MKAMQTSENGKRSTGNRRNRRSGLMIAGILLTTLFTAGCGRNQFDAPTPEISAPAEAGVEESLSSTEGGLSSTEEGLSSIEEGLTPMNAGKASLSEDEKYLVLVNKQHPVSQTWADGITFTRTTDTSGAEILVEEETFHAYESLKDYFAGQGIHLSIGSAYRSIEEQTALRDEYLVSYGEEYVRQYVADPGCSEHHTGLAIDLNILWVDGQDEPDYYAIWDQIHGDLARFGFILRYLPYTEDITGYSYEPWHIRYVGSPEIAEKIMSNGYTLEEYLGEVPEMKPDNFPCEYTEECFKEYYEDYPQDY